MSLLSRLLSRARRPARPLLALAALALPASRAPARDTLIDNTLAGVLQRAAPDDLVPIYVVLDQPLDAGSLRQRFADLPPRARRTAVARSLKQHFEQRGTALRALVSQAQAAGRARLEHVLWMGNALLLSARPDLLPELAALPGVRAIRARLPTRAEQVQDLLAPSPISAVATALAARLPAAPAAGSPGVGAYPFFDDFESGVLLPHWTLASSGAGQAQVTGDYDPIGNFHVVMDSAIDGVDSIASITVQLDLQGKTGVGLRFRQKEMSTNGTTGSDENNPEDGVFVSDDGVTYQQILLLNDQGAQYQAHWLLLDDAIAPLGLQFTRSFFVRFQWRDNFGAPNDGMAFDLIEIGPDVNGPPPALPTTNLVTQQAVKLWSEGYDGSGLLIGSIDSGTWKTHPDLADRLWTNPGEIAANGLDDDGNGYIDDTWGWDFEHDDNDPQSTDPHGTQTAGLMLGDGTSGTATGMAPGASLVSCEVMSEDQYWLAQQYLLDVGVDVISSSFSYKWFPVAPDYHMFRQLCDMEWAAGIIHANSVGNQGGQQLIYPVPFNIPAPGNVPSPFWFPGGEQAGRSSVLGCGGLNLADDTLYTPGGVGPAAWEDLTLYDPAWPFPQQPIYWDYPVGGFGGSGPGLIKPDLVAYTNNVTSTTIPSGNPPTFYAPFSGTSAATPQLGGALALLRQVQPAAEPRQLAAALELTAIDLGAPGKDNQFGAGHLRAWDAARRLVLLARAVPDVVNLGGNLELRIDGQPDTISFGFLGGLLVTNLGDWNLALPFFALPPFPTDAQGQLTLPIAVPNDPILAGLVVWAQFGQPKATSAWGKGHFLSVPEAILIAP